MKDKHHKRLFLKGWQYFARDPHTPVDKGEHTAWCDRYAETYGLPIGEVEAAVREGWQEAKGEWEKEGDVLFCLHEIRGMLSHPVSEWHEQMRQEVQHLVERVILGVEKYG